MLFGIFNVIAVLFKVIFCIEAGSEGLIWCLSREHGNLYWTIRHYQGLWCTISPRPLSEGGGVYATL
jgi:hypothetical protein